MKSFKEIMAKVASPTPAPPPPPNAGVSDDLDRGFVAWMEKKAGEDAVKTASCGMDHKKLKSGERCEKCGEKIASVSIQSVRKALSSASDNKAGIEEAVQNFAGKEKLKSLLKGTALGGAATAGAGALYLKGRRDQRAKTAGVAENAENLELMAKIRARFAAGQPLGGDV